MVTVNVTLSNKQRRYAMKPYDKIKAEVEAIQRQMVEWIYIKE